MSKCDLFVRTECVKFEEKDEIFMQNRLNEAEIVFEITRRTVVLNWKVKQFKKEEM